MNTQKALGEAVREHFGNVERVSKSRLSEYKKNHQQDLPGNVIWETQEQQAYNPESEPSLDKNSNFAKLKNLWQKPAYKSFVYVFALLLVLTLVVACLYFFKSNPVPKETD